MSYLNKILTAMTLCGVLLGLNRFSSFTRLEVGPYNFLRIQELNHIFILMLASVLLTFLLYLHFLNTRLINHKYFVPTSLLLITGIYFYSVGVGLHEVSNFINIKYCIDSANPLLNCDMVWFNDDVFSHLLYYLGFIMGVVAIILSEYVSAKNPINNKADKYFLNINALFMGLGIFWNTAFEAAGLDLIITLSMLFILISLFIKKVFIYNFHGFATYCLVAFSLGSFLSIVYKAIYLVI